jgi:molybdopterin-guanine dinucleotide biosynthesis protein B
MRVFGIAGHSGMGKTTLLERIHPELQARGLTVSLIKHSHKDLDIDHPGKDSYLLREALRVFDFPKQIGSSFLQNFESISAL